MNGDHYTTLGISYQANAEDIRKAYFLLARQLHPDANPDPSAREQFIMVQQAYEVLSDVKKRAEYDALITMAQKNAPQVSVNTRYNRSVFPALEEPQLAYVLLDLYCAAEIDLDRLPPSHVCLVIDQSTSMKGERLDMIKASAFFLLQQLRSQDMLSVVVFSDRAQVLVTPTRASSLSRSDSRISLLQAGGGTEIFQGLSLAMMQFNTTPASYTRQIIMITDGKTYGDEEECLELARDAATQGITINVIGIGHEWNDALMDQVSSLTGGNATFVKDEMDLTGFIQQKLADLSNVYAQGLHLSFESSPGVKLNYAFRLNPDITELPISDGGEISLGDMYYHQNISLLFEFLLPPIDAATKRITLVRGELGMKLAQQKNSHSRLLLDLTRDIGTPPAHEGVTAALMEALSRLTLYRMQQKVVRAVEAGDVEGATRRLQYLATNLLVQGDRDLAHTVLMEAEHIKQSHAFSKDGDKRIKYGTRSLLLPSGPEYRV